VPKDQKRLLPVEVSISIHRTGIVQAAETHLVVRPRSLPIVFTRPVLREAVVPEAIGTAHAAALHCGVHRSSQPFVF
jgi:hypothetical protein